MQPSSLDQVLFAAVRDGGPSDVERILDRGANVQAQGNMALRWAGLVGNTIAAALLLDRGADVHAHNDYALRYASTNGHTKTVELLLDRGANIHAENNHAARMAAVTGHAATLALLIERGADPRANDDEALWQQAFAPTPNPEVVALLLRLVDYPPELLADVRQRGVEQGAGGVVAMLDAFEQSQALSKQSSAPNQPAASSRSLTCIL